MNCLILGIGGQDGSYLADILLKQGHEVHGLYRRSSVDNLQRILHIRDQIILHPGDITDPSSVLRVLEDSQPDEIYNMADQDHVGWSLSTPGYSFDVTAKAVATTLEIVREEFSSARFFQPCSAVMFGNASPPQCESTSLNPQSPYACAKTAAYHLARYYRQVHGLFVSTAIFYNHDSPRRGDDYLLHQIHRSIVEIVRGNSDKIIVGNSDMVVDIGYAREYMQAAVGILRQDKAEDFVVASDYPQSIKDIIEDAMAFFAPNASYEITSDPSLLRPGKQPTLIGDCTKAHNQFGFSPQTNVHQLLKMLISLDLICPKGLYINRGLSCK